MAGLELKHLSPQSLKPAVYNPRKIGDVERAALARGITEFGLIDPIVCRAEDLLVLGGHQRLSVCMELGLETVPVALVPGLSDDQAAALNILLNNPKAQGAWDMKALSDVLSELDGNGFDATLTGFDEKELEGLLTWTAEPEPGNEEGDCDLTLPAEPSSKTGEVYQLGRHRLMCGDSTKAEDVAVLMGGSLAECLWTDPPYGVSYVGKTQDALTIQNDGGEGFDAFVMAAFVAADTALAPGGRVYCAVPPGPRNLAFRVAFMAVGWKLHQELTWVKNSMVLGHSDYHYRHEPILYGYKVGKGRVGRGNHAGSKWYGDHSQTSVFEVDKPPRSSEHPTMKPVALITPMLLNSSKPGDTVLDVFGGSGSTLIAAEMLGRSACLMEIDPRYCDVIRRRYEAYISQNAVAA